MPEQVGPQTAWLEHAPIAFWIVEAPHDSGDGGYVLWRLKGDQVKRLKELETENSRHRRAVSDLMLEKLSLAASLQHRAATLIAWIQAACTRSRHLASKQTHGANATSPNDDQETAPNAGAFEPGGDAVSHRVERAAEIQDRAVDLDYLKPYFAAAGRHAPTLVEYDLLRAAGRPVYATCAQARQVADTIMSSGLFNEKSYRSRLGAAGRNLDPVLHYVLVGETLGVRPSDQFDPVYYGERHLDVLAAGVNLLWHYAVHGRAEGRRGLPIAANFVADPDRFAADRETIILVSHEASRTGAPILALNVGRHLHERYNLITVLLRGGPLVESFEEISAQVILIENDEHRHPVEFKFLIRSILAEHAIRYALVNSICSSDIIPALARAFVPTVTLIHEFSSYMRPRGMMREALGWMSEPVFSADVVANSARDEHPALLQRRVHILPQGQCDLPTACEAGDQQAELKRLRQAMRPAGSEKALVVLGIGFMHIRKGVDLFVATAAAVMHLAPKRLVRFVWVGSGYDPDVDLSYSVYIAEQIARSGVANNVVILDEVADLGPAYAMADVFFLTSRLDPLPNVTIDAAMRGLPIVCFDGASGMADLLKRDPSTAATVVPHLDVAAAARLIVDLAENDEWRGRIADATRTFGQATFDMHRYVSKIDTIGGQAIESMDRWRADFETIRNDSLFDAEISSPSEGMAARDDAILRFLAYWSAARTAPHQVDHLDIRRPCPGFNPQIYASSHPEVLRADVNPFADFIRKGRPGGPWLHQVVCPDEFQRQTLRPPGLRTAVHAHFYYTELIEGFLYKLSTNTARCDLLITTNDDAKARVLRAATDGFAQGQVDVRVAPNRGRDIAPLFAAYGVEIARNYDVVGHFHGKRSLGIDAIQPGIGETWREFLWQHLIGDRFPMMDIALSYFAANDHLGLIFAEDPHLCDWSDNLAMAETLAARVGIDIPLPLFFEFPVGNMFWARPSALAPLLDLHLGWDDFPEEPVGEDGTIMHALERLLPFCAAKAGLTFATTHIPGITR
jgi:glycosyltransferase involved in cell wall biosynthesis